MAIYAIYEIENHKSKKGITNTYQTGRTELKVNRVLEIKRIDALSLSRFYFFIANL